MYKENALFVSLDIGTYKTAVIVAEATPADVASVIEVARAVALPTECEILHVLPQEFAVDGQERGREPVGTSGVRLEGSVHLVTVANGVLESIRRCCERAGLHVNSLQFAALAAAEAV